MSSRWQSYRELNKVIVGGSKQPEVTYADVCWRMLSSRWQSYTDLKSMMQQLRSAFVPAISSR
jgi:hypothetical protein